MREPGESFEYDGETLYVAKDSKNAKGEACFGCVRENEECAEFRVELGGCIDVTTAAGIVFVRNLEEYKAAIVARKLTGA
jgi:hypothetical protein